MFQNTEAIIYDLDGTIIDTEQFHRDAWKLTSQEYGLGFTGEAIYQASKGKSSIKTLEKILPVDRREIIKPAADAKFRYMMGLMENSTIKLLPGFMETFEALRENYNLPVGICTSARQENVEALRRNSNSLISKVLEALVGKVAWKEMFTTGKPSAEPLQVTLRMMRNPRPDRAVYIGDADVDYLCAQNAGTRFVYFCPEAAVKDMQIPLTMPQIEDHRELLQYLQ